MKDKGETSEGNHATNQTQSGRQVETNERQTGDKEGKSCDQPDPEWETSGRQMKTNVGNHATNQTQSGRQVGDK